MAGQLDRQVYGRETELASTRRPLTPTSRTQEPDIPGRPGARVPHSVRVCVAT